MTVLRWIAATLSVLSLLALGLILIVAEGFSAFRSGSGSDDWLGTLGLLGVTFLPIGVLALVILPESKTLAWIVGAAVALAFVGCLTLLGSHPGEASVYLFVLGIWLLFCWTAIRSAPAVH